MLNAKEQKFGHDYKDSFETTDFGLNTNVGVKIRLSDKINLFVEYELQIGLTDAFKGNVNEYNNARDAFNLGINFML